MRCSGASAPGHPVLASQVSGAPAGQRPWLVWLHGLLGSGADWQALLPDFTDFPCLTVDLPGHGASQALNAASLAEVNTLLGATLQQRGIQHYWLIGYSLGGRLASYHATQGGAGQPAPAGLCGLIVEAAHPGLAQANQRTERLRHDHGWAQRLRHEPLAPVLADWYQQPVFADLSPAQRTALVARRSANQGARVAMLLEACSLGHQPPLAQALSALALPFAFVCGAHDAKFQALAQQHHFPVHRIDQAGHNAHAANPAAFSATIHHLLNRRNPHHV
jgi:2-succinyl-6-hydroxy-2,4-cyclohexadiene-1-carboxylate synthase